MSSLLISFCLFVSVNAKAAADFTFHEGDILGESEVALDPDTSFFEAATQSRYGHVGVVLKSQNQLVVFEAYPPGAQVVMIGSFLDRSRGHYTVLRRKTGLSAVELTAVRNAATELVQKRVPYNYSQTMNDGSLNCSEFVHKVFSAAKISVGAVQKIKDMNLKSFHGYLWKLWQASTPDTKLEDSVVTPLSVMTSSNYVRVSGTLDPAKLYSDKELVQQWRAEGALNSIAELWQVTPAQIEKMANP
jgi:hypothetical protein